MKQSLCQSGLMTSVPQDSFPFFSILLYLPSLTWTQPSLSSSSYDKYPCSPRSTLSPPAPGPCYFRIVLHHDHHPWHCHDHRPLPLSPNHQWGRVCHQHDPLVTTPVTVIGPSSTAPSPPLHAEPVHHPQSPQATAVATAWLSPSPHRQHHRHRHHLRSRRTTTPVFITTDTIQDESQTL